MCFESGLPSTASFFAPMHGDAIRNLSGHNVHHELAKLGWIARAGGAFDCHAHNMARRMFGSKLDD